MNEWILILLCVYLTFFLLLYYIIIEQKNKQTNFENLKLFFNFYWFNDLLWILIVLCKQGNKTIKHSQHKCVNPININ
jgi:hypothetical protein